MQYEPSFVGLRPILSDDNKHWLLKQSLRYSLDRFKSDQRNYEEVMVDFVYTSVRLFATMRQVAIRLMCLFLKKII